MKTRKLKSKGKGRLKLTALIKFLDFSVINLSVEKRDGKRGRPPRNPEAMLKAFVVMVLKGYSERGLETFLRNYPFWNRLCGFKGRENRYYQKSSICCEFCDDDKEYRIVLFLARPTSTGWIHCFHPPAHTSGRNWICESLPDQSSL